MFFGYPGGSDKRQWLKTWQTLNRLPEMQSACVELEAELVERTWRPARNTTYALI